MKPVKTKSKANSNRHNPLARDIMEANSTLAKQKETHGRKGKLREERRKQKASQSQTVDFSLLDQARKQQKEEEYVPESKLIPNFVDSDDEEFSDDDNVSDLDTYEDFTIDEADQQALEMFLNPAGNAQKRLNLADIILEKINTRDSSGAASDRPTPSPLHPKVIQVYRGVGQVLQHYSAGKIPKAFKIVPSLNNWEEILYLTDPPNWSLPSCYAATRLFAANLNEKMAQRFYNIILLPRIMEDLTENKRLNYHLYRSLRKAVFKPSAFYKGIVLPLCEEGCTLKESFIIASAVAKASVPVFQSSAALYKLTQMPYNATVNIFMKTLLNKKYALPYRVIDQLVEYFSSFTNETRRLPVLWHQTVLIFAQRYKEDLTLEQKDAIKRVIKVHTHPLISLEIHRELDNSCCRGEVLNEEEMTSMMLEI